MSESEPRYALLAKIGDEPEKAVEFTISEFAELEAMGAKLTPDLAELVRRHRSRS